MVLKEIKEALLQTSLGEFLRDGMGCSEPLPLLTPDGLLDNCFLYMYNGEKNTYSAPVARIGFFAEKKEMVYFMSCYDKPFSLPPEQVIEAKLSKEERYEKYPAFERLYNQARPIFYKDVCSLEEKHLLLEFANTFEEYIDESQRVFYKEAVPPFFTWLSVQVRELLEDNDG